ncbi:MAG: hypothetical protein AB7V56_09900 [Candidatus Nitrosocosmicus sp.]|jgi:hypothetical protein
MSGSQNPNRGKNGLISRFVSFVVLGIILPLIIKRVRNQLVKEQLSNCERCKRKMEKISKNEYYCKDCKIIRIDDT